MPDSTLFNLLWTARYGSQAEKDAALIAAIATIALLQSLPSSVAFRQLIYRGRHGWGVLHLLALFFSRCEQVAFFLSLVIERGRESCGTTALMRLTDAYGATTLHYFAKNCLDTSLTKMVLREHPPSLAVLNNCGETPLCYLHAEKFCNGTSVFFRAATAAYNASNFAALVLLCGGSSPYLSREIAWQAIALRAAVAICLNRQEAAPSALDSIEAGVALSLLGRARDFGCVGVSSELLRVILEYVGPRAD